MKVLYFEVVFVYISLWFLGGNIIKTVGYHRHILRFSIFVMKFLRRCKPFVLEKNTASSSCFVIFPTLKFFWFFAKNLIIRIIKTFLRNHTIWNTFSGKFSNLSVFEKFQVFFQKFICFLKKLNFWTFWEVLFFQSHSTASFLRIGEKKISTRKVNERCERERNWQISNKKRTHLSGWFCAHNI